MPNEPGGILGPSGGSARQHLDTLEKIGVIGRENLAAQQKEAELQAAIAKKMVIQKKRSKDITALSKTYGKYLQKIKINQDTAAKGARAFRLAYARGAPLGKSLSISAKVMSRGMSGAALGAAALSLALLGIGAVFAALLIPLKFILDMFLGFNKEVVGISKNLFISSKHAAALKVEADGLQATMGKSVLISEDYEASQAALSKEFRTTGRFSKDMLHTVSRIAKTSEATTEEAAGMMRAYQILGKEGPKAMKGIAQGALKSGTHFNAIKGDLAKNTDLMYEFGTQATEAAVNKARLLGIELKSALGFANQFLDPLSMADKLFKLRLRTGIQLNAQEMARMRDANDFAGILEKVQSEIIRTGVDVNKMGGITKSIFKDIGLDPKLLAKLADTSQTIGDLVPEATGDPELDSNLQAMETAFGKMKNTWDSILKTMTSKNFEQALDAFGDIDYIMENVLNTFQMIQDPEGWSKLSRHLQDEFPMLDWLIPDESTKTAVRGLSTVGKLMNPTTFTLGLKDLFRPGGLFGNQHAGEVKTTLVLDSEQTRIFYRDAIASGVQEVITENSGLRTTGDM